MRFASDNSGPVHPRVMAALEAANDGWALPYGKDDWTARAVARVRDTFEAPEAAVYFVATGSAANVLALATITKPYQTIFCTPEAHIEEDECNGPEFYTGGAKLTLVDSRDARMDGVPVHLDGARFANAMVALGCSAAEMSWKAGVDIVSFGGTKNGLMGAEAVVIFDPQLAWEFELRRKRGGHLFSKNRFLAAQIDAYLTDDLWLDMARAANAAGQKLKAGLERIEGVELLHPAAANMIYAAFPAAAHRRLAEAGAQYYPERGATDGPADQPHNARMVADWSCPEDHIDRFLALVRGD